MTTAAAAAAGGLTEPLDPISFEVIRHRLWAINDDQARMAARLSGSPIVYDAYDFNAALVTADGRGLYTGVYIMHHGATIDSFVRRVLEEWPADEIREGDMYFTNDPWWGALHANDGILAMPIFWEDELVAWSGIVMHDNDVGGPVPGSWVTGARDRFGEAPLFPAIKMVENFEPRWDVERAYLRNSRTPDQNALNMRARVAALRTTYRRIGELIEQYGLSTFRAAQEQIIGYVERVLRRRLTEIPDGSWYAEGYHDHDGSENNVYPICCRVTKREDTLHFDMTGTALQADGPINCARPAMEGAVMGVILTFLCHDLPWTIGGLRPAVQIVSEPGTLHNATGAAPTSMASVMATLSTQDVVAAAVARMLLSSDRHASEAQATWTPGICTASYAATSAEGRFSVSPLGNSFAGGGGARTFCDGVDTGGVMHSMASRIPNTETLEGRSPVLQLFRREMRDGAGPGRFRGGAGVEYACTPHKTTGDASLNTLASGVAMPGGHGLSGGLPGAAVSNVVLRGSDIADVLSSGRIPMSADELAYTAAEVQEAKQLTRLSSGDVVIGAVGSGAGYGDPLRREPAAVLDDVIAGLVSPEASELVYGVVVRGQAVDGPATAAARTAIRRDRLNGGDVSAQVPAQDQLSGPATVLHGVLDTVEAVRGDDGDQLRCTVCGHRLGPAEDELAASAVARDLPLTAASPRNGRCSDDFVLCQVCCPGCGTAMLAGLARRDRAREP
ncbi:MAG TPA: hydantoinase B/oxoprolinase family protein [Solirubrobacteraceae bacterium]|nr:hydantoinase B/oxoprolinase family protein [Solirubrobacteraceae bacterium]